MFKRKDIKINENNIKKESYLEINKKIKDNGNKEFINVYKLMKHQIPYYIDIHDDSIRKAEDILKNKNYKVILALYNNEVIGYLDFNIENDTVEDLFIKEDFFNKEEALYQFLFLLTNEIKIHVIIKGNVKCKYNEKLREMGFIEKQ